MANEKNKWIDQMKNIMKEFQEQVSLAKGQVVVVGCSTSEVAGGKIGLLEQWMPQRLFLMNCKPMRSEGDSYHISMLRTFEQSFGY